MTQDEKAKLKATLKDALARAIKPEYHVYYHAEADPEWNQRKGWTVYRSKLNGKPGFTTLCVVQDAAEVDQRIAAEDDRISRVHGRSVVSIAKWFSVPEEDTPCRS